MQNGVSAVICCFNSAGRISQTLTSLLKQEYDKSIHWEVIVIDNDSQDNTAGVARQIWQSGPVPLYIVHEPRKGLSNARQRGFQESHYTLVSFIDDDNWVCPDWITRVYTVMQSNPNVALLGGKGEAVFEKGEPEWFMRYKHCYAIGPQAEKEGILESRTSFLYGAGLTVRKEVWNIILEKGFTFQLSGRSGNNITSGEDKEMCYVIRLAGYELYYDPALTFKHYMPEGRMTVPYLVKLAESFGRASVISDMYRSLLMNRKGLARLKTSSFIFSLLRSVFSFLLYLPEYYKLKKPSNNPVAAAFRYAYKLGCIKEKLNLMSNYHKIYRTITAYISKMTFVTLR